MEKKGQTKTSKEVIWGFTAAAVFVLVKNAAYKRETGRLQTVRAKGPSVGLLRMTEAESEDICA